MNKAPVTNLLNRDEHLKQNMDGDLEAVRLLKTSPSPSQIYSKQVHDYQILFRILNKVVNASYVFQA